MKSWSYVLLFISVAALFTSCGTSERGCIEDCANASMKKLTLCKAQHGGSSCSNLTIAENDQCSARCYGG